MNLFQLIKGFILHFILNVFDKLVICNLIRILYQY